MCGRFTLHQDERDVLARFGVQDSLFTEWTARFNIAPSQPVAAVTVHGPSQARLLEPLRWGLVPSWAKDPAMGNKLINARSETVAEKPSFRSALSRRRCLIPADGFYEWERATKQPMHFRLKGGALFSFAGLYEEWIGPDGSPLRTCTLLTTRANGVVGPVHDRQPVILPDTDAEDAWLDVAQVRPPDLIPLLEPLPDERMEAFPVGKRVGSPFVDEPSLLVPA
jgi:putative SOS response-associated peptidase YedK